VLLNLLSCLNNCGAHGLVLNKFALGMLLVLISKKCMATATKKRTASKKSGSKKTVSKKPATKKRSTKKNKLGVKNSLVNNINAHKKKGDSKPRRKSTVDKKQYKKMEENWGKKE